VEQMLHVIESEVARIGSVLENFSDFASLGSLHRSEVDMAALVRRQVKLFIPRAEKQGITITIEHPQQTLPPIQGDPVRLEQVVLNLLINALEAMPQGGQLTVRLKAIDDLPSHRWLSIEVIDTGNGIPENVLEHIFDPYFSTKNGGTGMGLAICDKIVRQHLGRVECRTTEHGTTFEIQLPVDEPTPVFAQNISPLHPFESDVQGK
jgi:two-component system, NtrC family, sensor histidine kinase HydH